jgi:hypothetical protein
MDWCGVFEIMSQVWNPLALHFAKMVHDGSIEPKKRLVAAIILSDLAAIGGLTVEEKTEAPKPEYVWRNGARVKTR